MRIRSRCREECNALHALPVHPHTQSLGTHAHQKQVQGKVQRFACSSSAGLQVVSGEHEA